MNQSRTSTIDRWRDDQRLQDYLDSHGYWFVASPDVQEAATKRAVKRGILQPVERLLRQDRRFHGRKDGASHFYVRGALTSIYDLPASVWRHLVEGVPSVGDLVVTCEVCGNLTRLRRGPRRAAFRESGGVARGVGVHRGDKMLDAVRGSPR